MRRSIKAPRCERFRFLKSQFIEECKSSKKESITVDKRSYRVVIKSVICDPSARSFVRQIIPHTGKYGCELCVQRGIKNHAMSYHVRDSKLRNNSDFRKQTNQPHHEGISTFTQLNIGMVYGFPLDYMHLICIGVMKRLLLLWRGEKNTVCASSRKRKSKNKETKKTLDRVHRLTLDQLNTISARKAAVSKQFTSEFNRKRRGLN